MKKKFILFLKREGAYASFRKNLISTRMRNNIKDGHISPGVINLSFSWKDSKEGYEFWAKIHDYWCYSASKMNIKDFYRYV